MSTFEIETIEALTTLFEKVGKLQQMHIRDLLLPEKYKEYRATLDAAYDALVHVEDALDSLGMKLEREHFRIESALEEIKPLLLQTRSQADMTLETMQQDLERKQPPLL